jgi:preprotein translocase subunit SecD
MTENDELVEKKKDSYRAGLAIFILLIAFTIGEYGIAAVGANIAIVFFVISLIKSFFILRDYMHVGRLFNNQEEH